MLLATQGCLNAQIRRELALNVETVRVWRNRWVGLQGIDVETLCGAERVHDAPRPGALPTFTEEHRCQNPHSAV